MKRYTNVVYLLLFTNSPAEYFHTTLLGNPHPTLGQIHTYIYIYTDISPPLPKLASLRYTVSSKEGLFADDRSIYRNIKNKEDQIALLKDLNLLENWGNTWGMRFNAAKCNIMRVSRTRDPKLFSYSLTGQVLEEVMNTKYLGVTTWSGQNT